MEQHLNVLIQSSDYYAPFAGVMLTSLLENNRDMEQITVYLMTADMSEKNRVRFQTLAAQYKRVIEFIDTKKIDRVLENNHVPSYRGAYATYYKIFALSVIEDELDRLIYLDSDMLVTGSLAELMTCDLEDNALGMCIDAMPSKYKKLINCNSQFYYNAGMIVFNVEKWISGQCTDKVLEHIRKVRSAYPTADQDLLNIVFEGQIQTLQLTYNLNTGILWYKDYNFFVAAYGIKNYYSAEEFTQVKQEPTILHYLGTFGIRPWQKRWQPGKKIWEQYLKTSLWDDYTCSGHRRSLVNKVQYMLFKLLPNKAFAMLNRNFAYLSYMRLNHKLKSVATNRG